MVYIHIFRKKNLNKKVLKIKYSLDYNQVRVQFTIGQKIKRECN